MKINIRETDDRKLYFTSDLHLGHQRDFVWKARGYNSPSDHDSGVIAEINRKVRHSDILFMLGDFCLNTPIDKMNEYLSHIQCQNIYCLWGNHNSPHEKWVYNSAHTTQIRGTYKYTYPFEYRNLVFLPHYIEAVFNGQFTVLLHYPIYVWNEMQSGAWMLCGHSHGGCPFSRPDNLSNKILDCGWDLHKTPLSFEELKEIMDMKGFVAMDNHHIPSIVPSNPLVMTGVTGAKFSAS